jgi:hypothetical protein
MLRLIKYFGEKGVLLLKLHTDSFCKKKYLNIVFFRKRITVTPGASRPASQLTQRYQKIKKNCRIFSYSDKDFMELPITTVYFILPWRRGMFSLCLQSRGSWDRISLGYGVVAFIGRKNNQLIILSNVQNKNGVALRTLNEGATKICRLVNLSTQIFVDPN